MSETEKIFRDFIQNDEALNAEVTSSGVMLSEEDCLTLMDRAVKNYDLLHNISNQSKLLIAFSDWWNREYADFKDCEPEELIEFLEKCNK